MDISERTLHRPGMDNGASLADMSMNDQTFRTDRRDVAQPSMDMNTEHTYRGEGATAQVSTPNDDFLLKGVGYKNVKCLSENSGEAQVFLVTNEDKEYVLKVYYPNFDINRKLLQAIHSLNFEMIVKVYDFGKTYVDGKSRYYELMEYLCGGTLDKYVLGGDLHIFRRLALQAAAALAYCQSCICGCL